MKNMKQCRQIMKKDMILISQKKSYSLMKHWLKISYHLMMVILLHIFQNLTTAALFCWIYKHNISTNAYENLVDIIMRPEFNRDHIQNLSQFHQKKHHNFKGFKDAYQLSISDIIWNVLNKPITIKGNVFWCWCRFKNKIRVLAWYLMGRVTSFRSKKQLMISGGNYLLNAS
ncbi:hypothetical protein GLOIN_2v1776429 [Rhizophagus clarus]|uniref:Uncharacterized protein n=1 Tax=Rhizophagus clarus TaxID=94130 RepID=A0A8H3QNI6_9GLOM|nr:hypothetical protein GLOIN_2v1776429 [Rhizophagus clarus]